MLMIRNVWQQLERRKQTETEKFCFIVNEWITLVYKDFGVNEIDIIAIQNRSPKSKCYLHFDLSDLGFKLSNNLIVTMYVCTSST